MPKKVYVEHFGHEDGPQIKVKKIFIDENEECCGGHHEHKKNKNDDECCGKHKHGDHKHKEHKHHEFKDHKQFRKSKHEKRRHHVHVRPRFEKKMKTKMFTSKESLVAYVNEVGELGHAIDVFKISEDLFKVVVVERVELKQEVEVEVEGNPGTDEEIEVKVEVE